jgi:hypothetical protein
MKVIAYVEFAMSVLAALLWVGVYLWGTFVERFIIYGCEASGNKKSAYMTRYFLAEMAGGRRVMLHRFHRSDSVELHDHPWSFISVILWRGYFEETFDPNVNIVGNHPARRRKRVWPGTIIFRRADHAHRVVLVDGKPAVTLVITGPKVRSWGFHTGRGWQYWRDYFQERGC